MQQSQSPSRGLLTALEVQDLLHIDRSTVYRMAEDGRLPAIRVGRSWRFPADRIEALLAADGAEALPGASPPATAPAGAARPSGVDATAPVPAARTAPSPTTAQPAPAPSLDTGAAHAAVEVAADLLGVMMLVTDMHGRPITDVANPCAWFAEHSDEPGVLDRCVTEWRDLADHPDLTPRFQPGALGFECARAFIRSGTSLVGMVLAGGVSPSADPGTDPDLYHLDEAQRDRVLAALPRIAAAISTTTPRAAADTTPAPRPADAMKEN
jgi:excisionase family DNA binding protein